MALYVCFVVSDISATGGIERVISQLASKLSEHDFEVKIISLHKTAKELPYPINNKVVVEFIDDKCKPVSKPGSLSRMFNHIKSAFKANIKILKNKNATLVVNTFPMAFVLMPSLFFVKRKYVVEHVHYHYYSNALSKVRRFIYSNFSKVIVLTDRDKLAYSEMGLDAVTIPNPLSFVPAEISDSNITKKKIIAVGRLEFQKGFDVLINAFNMIPDDVKSNWELHIYGEGSEKKELSKLIDTYNLKNSVYLKGNANNLEDIYKSYDFFVMSSRFEGFGMVLLEAMSCGLPCISFDCPTGPREILDSGEFGLLVNNQDEDKLKSEMINLMSNVSLRKKLAVKSIERSRLYLVDNIIEKWKSLLKY